MFKKEGALRRPLYFFYLSFPRMKGKEYAYNDIDMYFV